MDPVVIDFTMWRNADFSYRLSFIDAGSGAPVDFTGASFEMDIKAQSGGGDPAASVTIGTAELAQGHVDLALVTNALPVGRFVYDLVRIEGVGRQLVAMGLFTVIEGVTQP